MSSLIKDSQDSYFQKFNWKTISRALLTLFVATLIGCGDSDNNNDDDTQPPPPPPPPAPAPTVTSATSLNIDIENVSYTDGKLRVDYFVTNEEGYGFVASEENTNNVRFTIAKLIPASDGEPTSWQSFLNRVETADVNDFPESMPEVQAQNESPSDENPVTNNNDGHYYYTLAADLSSVTDPLTGDPIPWEEDLTHRVAIEFRETDNNPAQNAVYDWVPSGNTITDTRDIVAIESCNSCHTDLELHGGNRINTSYCVTCHNPGSVDSQSSNTVDFSSLIHKIHRGANLPGIAAAGAGAKYSIFGYRDREHIYSENDGTTVSGTHFPQDIRNCTNCHVGQEDKDSDPSAMAEVTKDGDNWKNVPSLEACSSCHDDVAFNNEMLMANPFMHKHEALFPASNEDCATCHASGTEFETEMYHVDMMRNNKAAAANLVFKAKSIAKANEAIDVTISITLNDEPVEKIEDISDLLISHDHAYVLINWDNGDGYMTSYGVNNIYISTCVASSTVGDFVCPWNTSSLNNGEELTTGTLAVTFADAGVCVEKSEHELIDCAETNVDIDRVATPLNKTYFDLTTYTITNVYEEKFGADLDACKTCHSNDITLHVGSHPHFATDFAQCKSCHNATRAAFYAGRPADLKYHVHKLHAASSGPTGEWDGVEHFPSPINNCLQCHTIDQIDLPLQQNYRASTTNNPASFVSPVFTSPITTVCTTCHIVPTPGYIDAQGQPILDTTISEEDQNVINHMILAGGASFGASSAGKATGTEACAACHAINSSAGVDKVHGLVQE